MQEAAVKKKRRKKWLYLYMLLILFVLSAVATYTWFTLSKTPKVNDLGLFISTPTGIELSWDGSEDSWLQHLDYTDKYPLDTVLKPVTWSDADESFYAAVFGTDGRIVAVENKLFDTENVNRSDALGYYAKATFYARSDERVAAALTPAAVTGNDGSPVGTYVIGTPVWDTENIIHDDGGNGADASIRLAFRITQLDADGNPRTDVQPEFRIYEPNCNKHIDGSTDYKITESIDGYNLPLISDDRLIRQTASSWSETNPIARTALIYDFGEFQSDTHLFNLDAGETVQIELYVWLEGQDIDCTNAIGKGAQILACVMFTADYEGHPGLQPIE